MSIRSSDQISLVDLTDGYSVILTNDSYVFAGSTNAAKAGSTTTTVLAMCGANQVAAAVDNASIVAPTGVTTSVDNNVTQPTITISVSTSVTTGGTVDIPVLLDGGNIIIHKYFTFNIAFTGESGTSSRWYTGTKITGTSTTSKVFSKSGISSAKIGDMYLNTDTMNTYRCTTAGAASAAKWAYVGNIKGATGAVGEGSIWYTGNKLTGISATETIFPDSEITNAKVGDMYLNIDTNNTYRCTVEGDASVAKWIYVNNIKGLKGDTGDKGEDAITISVTSSNGTIFKNTSISTILTAHVYKAGSELTDEQITDIGTIKWYKDNSDVAISTGAVLNINSGDVNNKAVYIVQLEE